VAAALTASRKQFREVTSLAVVVVVVVAVAVEAAPFTRTSGSRRRRLPAIYPRRGVAEEEKSVSATTTSTKELQL